MTINEGLGWLQTLKARHAELINLRNANARATTIRYGTDNNEKVEPTYDAKKLDKRVTLLAREIRLLSEAIKRANATTEVPGFNRNDEVLGELED